MDQHPVRYAAYQAMLPDKTFPGPGGMPVRKDGDGRVGLLAERLQPFRVGEQSASVLRQANMAAAAIEQRKDHRLVPASH